MAHCIDYPPLPGNPGTGAHLTMNFADGTQESYDLPELLATALAEAGFLLERVGDWLWHEASGYQLLVQLGSLELDGRVQSTTTIQIHHPTLFPAGIFEYQHSFGATLEESFSYGFKLWLDTDWSLLLAAATGNGEEASNMEILIADGRRRRVYFSGVQYWQETPRDSGANGHPRDCPCCLFTNSVAAFGPLLEGSDNYALRLFVVRNLDGTLAADCRVNGEDYPAALDSLRAFAADWPGAEFRKQYVLIVDV